MRVDAIRTGESGRETGEPVEQVRAAARTSRPLTALGGALLVVAAAFALRVAFSGELALPPTESAAAAARDGAALAGHLAQARQAESAGEVARALAGYRAAARIDPRIVDLRAPQFLGPRFEAALRDWAEGLRSGRIPGGPAAREDAAYLYRRMYGGCG